MTMMPLLCFLAVSAVALTLTARLLFRSSGKMEGRVHDILSLTITNNTYPPLLDVLSTLDDDLGKLDQKLNADMHGYMDYVESKS